VGLGLYHLRARDYDPETGTFTSFDPEDNTNADPSDLHKYLYAEASPVDEEDPSGHGDFSAGDVSVATGIATTLGGVLANPSVDAEIQAEGTVLLEEAASTVGEVESGLSNTVEDAEAEQQEIVAGLGQQYAAIRQIAGEQGAGLLGHELGADVEDLAHDVLQEAVPSGAEVLRDFVVGDAGPGKDVDFFVESNGVSVYAENKLALPSPDSGEQWTRCVNELANAFSHGGPNANVVLNIASPPPSDRLAQWLGDLDEAVPGIAERLHVTTSLTQFYRTVKGFF
jgi:RHS repeat-associated protein